MTLTLKDFIHQVLFQWLFVFLAIFGLGKVLWFCLTKVLGKNQSYTNLYWFCKNLQVGTESGEKTKIPRKPEISRNYKIFRILHVYVELCTNRAFGSVKRYLTLPGT